MKNEKRLYYGIEDGVCGVYLLLNQKNGKTYVGSSRNILKRFYNESLCYKLQSSNNESLCKDMKKFGKNNFLFTVLEECEESELLKREEFYIKMYDSIKTGYNRQHAYIEEVAND